MREQIKKLIVVISLTLLIWSGAYLADEEVTTQTVTLDISTTTSNKILVTFEGVEMPLTYELDLKGPAAKVAELRTKLLSDNPKEKERLNFIWNVEHEKKTDLKQYSLNVVEFIKNSDKMETLRLSVEPPKIKIKPIDVKIEKLVKKTLMIQVRDEDGVALKAKTIEPAETIEMFVHSDWFDDKLKAYVTLTGPQVLKARRGYVSGVPYVKLNNGTIREAPRCNITLPPTAQALANKPQYLRIGYIGSKELLGKYEVKLLNEDEFTRKTDIMATDKAHAAFDKIQYQVLVEIHDNDIAKEKIEREVIYNFPPEYVKSNEIELNEEHRIAKFKLVPIQTQ